MSKADNIFINNIIDIIENGVWDTDYDVRPKWEDGTPAHTIKRFSIVNRYNLQEEFPMMTMRKTNWKAALDEILWIWQRKSNNVNDLNSHIWDSWANENGSIGKAYGGQFAKKIDFGNGIVVDQVDKVLMDLKENPMSRRIMTNLYVHSDLKDMALAPCCYSCTFDVADGKLNMLLNQRSQDMVVANNWNIVQYSFLLYMIAQSTGYIPGEIVHVIANAHIYDRHIDIAKKIIEGEMYNAPTIKLNPDIKDFYKFTVDDFKVENYEYDKRKIGKIPVAV